MKKFESRIFAGVPGDGDRLYLLRHPAGDSFSDPHRNFTDQPGMRIFRSMQDEVFSILVDQVNQAGITPRDIDHEIDNLPQNLVEVERGAYRLTDLVQDSKLLPRKIKRPLNCLDGVVVTSHSVISTHLTGIEVLKPYRRLPELPSRN